jgi:hypothetical protein
MSLVIPPRHGQVSFLFRGPNTESSDSVITLGVRQANQALNFDPGPQEMVDRFVQAYTTFHTDRAVSQWVFEGCKMKYNDDGTMRDFEKLVEVPGGSAATPLPSNIAALVKKTTSVAGRVGKGRFFIPGILTADVVNGSGIISTAAVVAIQAKLTVLYQDLKRTAAAAQLDEDNATIWVLHRTSDTMPIAPPPSEVTGFTLSNKIGTQRSRLR